MHLCREPAGLVKCAKKSFPQSFDVVAHCGRTAVVRVNITMLIVP